MYEIDPERLDLAREFRARPHGRHSAELQRVLNRMRLQPLAGRYALVVVEPYRRWMLARLSGRRGVPPTLFPDRQFDDIAEAEWAIFRLRWEALTGRRLELPA